LTYTHNCPSEKLAKADGPFNSIYQGLRGKRQHKAIFAHGGQLAETTAPHQAKR